MLPRRSAYNDYDSTVVLHNYPSEIKIFYLFQYNTIDTVCQYVIIYAVHERFIHLPARMRIFYGCDML